jgi:hypothetical protein
MCVCVCTYLFLSFNVTHIGDLLISKLHSNFESKLNTISKKNKTDMLYSLMCTCTFISKTWNAHQIMLSVKTDISNL